MPAAAMFPARTFPAARMRAAAPQAPGRTTRPATPGRHRRALTVRSRATRAIDVLGHVGSLVTLSSVLVLAATAGGIVDGVPAGEAPTVTVTFDGSHR